MGGEDLEKNIDIEGDKEVQVISSPGSRSNSIAIENAGLGLAAEVQSHKKDAHAVSTTPAPEPPPNGGLTAWLQVAGSFFLFFNTWFVMSHSYFMF